MVNTLGLLSSFLFLLLTTSFANVVLIGNNVTLSFVDIEANFAPPVKGSGICGTLILAEPLDGCLPLTYKGNSTGNNTSFPIALIMRGGCSFEDKVRRAQAAGFKAAIVYDYDNGDLVAMAGNSAGIKIYAVFVAKASGEKLKKYAGNTDMELWLIPSFENSAWSIMAISFISLLAMSAVLATCFFVRRHRIRRDRPRSSRVREFHGMSGRLVKAMPSLIFTAVLEDNCTSMTCAICLEDYSVGDKIRILPCRHKFHAICVDAWLTTWRTFCPVCKRDARTSTGEAPASERTPLLSSGGGGGGPGSVASSSSALSSFRSSVASSSAIQIALPESPSRSHHSSFSSSRSPYLSMSRSSIDLRNAASSSQRSHNASSQHLMISSPHSSGYPYISPLNTRYNNNNMSSHHLYIPSPSTASSYIGSSSRHQQQQPLHCSESAASFSPFASAQSLPGC